jgi:hypothetical protein
MAGNRGGYHHGWGVAGEPLNIIPDTDCIVRRKTTCAIHPSMLWYASVTVCDGTTTQHAAVSPAGGGGSEQLSAPLPLTLELVAFHIIRGQFSIPRAPSKAPGPDKRLRV